MQRDGYYIFATHQLETWGRPPETLKAYLRQQERWAEGTIRDIKYHFWDIMKNKKLGFTEKFEFAFQAGHYVGSIFMLLGFALAPFGFKINDLITSNLLIFYITATFLPENLYKVPILEIYKSMFLKMPIYSKAIIKGLLITKSEWHVTKRKKLS